ncbi:MAG: PilT/PilU family type 4a pilus ATPase [Bdellovibrionota bacterium]
MAKIDSLLKKAVESGASDLHVAVGVPPIIRQFGELKRFKFQDLTAEMTQTLLYEILSPEQRKTFESEWELDFAYELAGLARFRANAFKQRKGIDLCFRVVKLQVPTFEELGIPDIMKTICDNHQGLILITGGAGTGKSTTLAAMVNYINSSRAHHVLTAEDPIEYVHPVLKGAVNQRQLGIHTKSYSNALRAALRENPDVIMVGDLRDLETISLAISASETGHLVIGSMNTSSAHKTIDKVIDSYPANQQNQIRAMLGETLKAVFTQRLLPKPDGTGVVLAYELLLGSLQLANLIKDGKTFQIPNLMQTGKSRGMRLMDDTLLELAEKGAITGETALKNAVNPKLFAKWASPGQGTEGAEASAQPGAVPAPARPTAPGSPPAAPRPGQPPAPGVRPPQPGIPGAARPAQPGTAPPRPAGTIPPKPGVK